MNLKDIKIGYVLYENLGSYGMVDDENSHLLDFLQQKELNIHGVIWSDASVNWKSFDLLVLKAPWDYFERFEEFNQWLEMLQSENIPLLNPIETVKWNSDKHYLKEISDNGFSVTPMVFLEKAQRPDLASCFTKWNTDRVVIKPCVSGGSRHTYAIERGQEEEFVPLLQKLLQSESFLVQPFIKEIADGEWSFVFFNGLFSHALIKKPKGDDFRVQHHFGGSIHPVTPSAERIALARQYVDRFAKGCLYARVDGVFVNDVFELMELELIEPALYLFTHPDAYENYYRALLKIIERRAIVTETI